MLHLLGEGWLKLPSPLDAVMNSSMESLIMACCGVGVKVHLGPHVGFEGLMNNN
jgi:hypothetical protein